MLHMLHWTCRGKHYHHLHSDCNLIYNQLLYCVMYQHQKLHQHLFQHISSAVRLLLNVVSVIVIIPVVPMPVATTPFPTKLKTSKCETRTNLRPLIKNSNTLNSLVNKISEVLTTTIEFRCTDNTT